MNGLRIGFLDQLHPAIRDAINTNLPADWTAIHSVSRDFADQAATITDADAVYVFATPVRTALIEKAAKLRLVHKLGAGVDNIDLQTCAARGIAVARLSGGNAVQVAEHTILLMLAASRRLVELDRRTRAGEWLKEDSRGRNHQLQGKQIGLVGFGAIGRQVAKMLLPFGVDIVYYDVAGLRSDEERQLQVRRLDLDDLLATSDIVSLHVPLMDATLNLLNAERLEKMKHGAILVNCARGGLIDEAALVEALENGHLAAAALDTFVKEPPSGSRLLELKQTIVTPHVAGVSIENFVGVLRAAISNTASYFGGQGLPAACAVVTPNIDSANER